MKNILKWILGIVIVLVVFFGLGFLFRFAGLRHVFYGWNVGHMPMMGFGFGFMPFGMIFMWLIPLAFLVMLVLGVIWAVKSLQGPQASTPSRVCGQCGKAAQPDWKNCPYCGNPL